MTARRVGRYQALHGCDTTETVAADHIETPGGRPVKSLLLVCVIALVQVAPTEEVVLTSGEVLRGQVIEQTADLVILEHPLLGRTEIPTAAVKEVRFIPPAPAAELPAEPPPPAEPAAAEAVRAAPSKPRWKSKLEFGTTGSAGVSEEFDLRIAFGSALKEETRRYTFASSYYLDTNQGDKTDSKAYADLLAEWPFRRSPWAVFVHPRYDFDEFQSWKHRVTVGGGLSYLLFDFDRTDEAGASVDIFEMYVRGGLGGRREWGSENEDVQPEALVGLSIDWYITDRQRLTGRSTIFPDLDETGEFRALSKLDWTLDLDRWDGVALRFGLEWEYQSINDPGVSPNDLDVYASLVVGF
ncbi:MAG: DUF481 domain-containing protein [Planctomycetota bacterium]